MISLLLFLALLAAQEGQELPRSRFGIELGQPFDAAAFEAGEGQRLDLLTIYEFEADDAAVVVETTGEGRVVALIWTVCCYSRPGAAQVKDEAMGRYRGRLVRRAVSSGGGFALTFRDGRTELLVAADTLDGEYRIRTVLIDLEFDLARYLLEASERLRSKRTQSALP